jgi:sulfur carrier protein
MNVTINGTKTEVGSATKVGDVAAELARGRRSGVAIAINGEVVPKSEWERVALAEGDRVEVLTAIGGG